MNEVIDSIDIDSYLDRYKLRHGEVISTLLPTGDADTYITDEDINAYLGERSQIAVGLGDYRAYMAINPKRLSRKKNIFITYVPHHDIPMFIGAGGRNIKGIGSELAWIYKEQFPELPQDLRISIIVKPLFVESQMVVRIKEERYIYMFEIDRDDKGDHKKMLDALSENYVHPLHSETYYKKGQHRTVIYFKGRETADKAYAMLQDRFSLREKKDPVKFYSKVKSTYLEDSDA